MFIVFTCLYMVSHKPAFYSIYMVPYKRTFFTLYMAPYKPEFYSLYMVSYKPAFYRLFTWHPTNQHLFDSIRFFRVSTSYKIIYIYTHCNKYKYRNTARIPDCASAIFSGAFVLLCLWLLLLTTSQRPKPCLSISKLAASTLPLCSLSSQSLWALIHSSACWSGHWGGWWAVWKTHSPRM